MVVRAPFLRWDIIRNPSDSSARRALYYLETARGQQVIAALAVRGQDNRLVYQPFAQFVEDYQDLLSLGNVAACSYGFQLNAWLDDIVYHSFVRYSKEGYCRDYCLVPAEMLCLLLSFDVAAFPEVAERIYDITANSITIDTPNPLSLELLDKLAEPKKCSITLKAYMYNYAGIAHCRFNVHSMTDETAPETLQSSHQHLALPLATPNKKEKLDVSSPSDKTTEGNVSKKPKLN
ncbi:hypothetical protein RHSIM_Rhsim05G0146500 [Rhododendron simsii]|uniref:Uncharacterized protein n=1 Tax=Rhododendron simsii TaxID=118357 RepID=A0A834LL66_RHOSS|nr:hypothetical protein RHSIM_Rhsim05G0146500 [Rhododendron simsii]